MLHEKIETQTNAKSKECNVKNEKSAKWKKYKKTVKYWKKCTRTVHYSAQMDNGPSRTDRYTLVYKITGNILNVEGNIYYKQKISLREKYPFSELFWSVFSRIRTEYWILRIQSKCGKVRTRITLKTDTFYEPSANKLREPSANKSSAFKT